MKITKRGNGLHGNVLFKVSEFDTPKVFLKFPDGTVRVRSPSQVSDSEWQYETTQEEYLKVIRR